MNKNQLVSALKFAGAAVIVIVAGLIMFPVLLSFAFGVGRLLLWVAVVLLVAHGLRHIWNTFAVKRGSQKPLNKPSSNKLLLIAALLQSISAPSAWAQNGGADTALIIPAGTIFEGRIDTKIGSAISHDGQRFHIIIANPVLANGATVLIPAGARVLGEVVEAIPASHVYHEKGTTKPKGKLRIQLTALELPDGAIFPMVASVAGEYFGTSYHHTENPNLGHGVGYVGSAAGFNQVTPQSQYSSNGRTLKPQLVSRDQMLKDPLYGVGQTQNNGGYGNHPVYRELEQHKNNIEIENGAPLSVKLDAALKIPFEEIMQSVHSGKGLPAALGLEQTRPKAKPKHKSSKPAGEPIQYKQEQPGASFVPGVEGGGVQPGSVQQPQQPPKAAPSLSPADGGDAGF